MLNKVVDGYDKKSIFLFFLVFYIFLFEFFKKETL